MPKLRRPCSDLDHRPEALLWPDSTLLSVGRATVTSCLFFGSQQDNRHANPPTGAQISLPGSAPKHLPASLARHSSRRAPHAPGVGQLSQLTFFELPADTALQPYKSQLQSKPLSIRAQSFAIPRTPLSMSSFCGHKTSGHPDKPNPWPAVWTAPGHWRPVQFRARSGKLTARARKTKVPPMPVFPRQPKTGPHKKKKKHGHGSSC